MKKRYVDVRRCLLENVWHKKENQYDLQRMFYDGVVDIPEIDSEIENTPSDEQPSETVEE